MERIGWSLVDGNGTELAFWGDTLGQVRGLPDKILLPDGGEIHAPSPGGIQDWQLVPRFAQRGVDPTSFDGEKVIISVPVTLEEIVAERERRLALGFNYDFGDERGKHRIATTDADMKGWREVDDLAQTYINLGQPTGPLVIETQTGSANITAMEWQQIKLEAAKFRQPLWLRSFMLQAMSPIPGNFTDDSYWS